MERIYLVIGLHRIGKGFPIHGLGVHERNRLVMVDNVIKRAFNAHEVRALGLRVKPLGDASGRDLNAAD